jgi:hypothetical protein
MDSIAQIWFEAFMKTVMTHEASAVLHEAADSGALKQWTEALTGIVVGTFSKMGWRGAARGHRSRSVNSEMVLAYWHIGRKIGDSPHGRWRIPIVNALCSELLRAPG